MQTSVVEEGIPYFESIAFISYSRHDIATARRLQHDLEWYRVPSGLQTRFDPKKSMRYLRPIILDKTDLEVGIGPYWKNIEGHLSRTRFLIVLCSPHSAASKYVDREVRYFLSSRPDAWQHMIPIVIDGRINAPDSTLECFPPSLRELGDDLKRRNLPTLVNSTREEVMLQAATFLLSARFATISDRYQREKRRYLQRWLAGTLGVALLFGVIAVYAVFQFLEARAQRRTAETERDRANVQTDLARGAEHETLQRATRAFAANSFLAWLLESDKTTIAEAVRSAAEHLDGGVFKDKPIIEAGLRLSIGRSLHSSGHLEEADIQLKRAVELFRISTGPKTGGIESEDVNLPHISLHIARKAEFLYGDELAKSLSELALVRLDRNRPGEGEVLIREAIDLVDPPADADVLQRMRAFNSNEPPTSVVEYRGHLAEMLAAQDKGAEAEAVWQKAISAAKALPSQEPMLHCCLGLGRYYAIKGKPAEAEAVYQQAISDLPADAPNHGFIRGSLLAAIGVLCNKNGRAAEAEKYFYEALILLRPFFQSGQSIYTDVVQEYERLLDTQHRPEECETVCRENLAFLRQSPQAGDTDLMYSLLRLASQIGVQGQLEEAIKLLREAITRGHAFPPQSDEQLLLRSLLYKCLAAQADQFLADGKLIEAQPLLRECVRLQSQGLSPQVEPLGLFHTDMLCAKVLEQAGERLEQEEVLVRAVEVGRAIWPGGSAELATALNDLGICLIDRNAFDKAEPFATEAMEMTAKFPSADGANLAISVRNVGILRLSQGRLKEAEALLGRAVGLARKSLPATDARSLQIKSDLALNYLKETNYKAAEPLLRECLAHRKITHDDAPTQTDQLVGAELQDLLRKTGRSSEADGVASEFGVSPFSTPTLPK